MKEITVYNLGGLPTADVSEFHELQEDFKLENSDKLAKLQMLIIERGFKYAFCAWQAEDGKLYIIDAHQRRKALLALRKRGWDIPAIPYQPIHAADKREAVEEIAAFNSEFGDKNPNTLLFEKYEIDSNVMDTFALPFEAITVDPVSYNSGAFSIDNPEIDAEELARDVDIDIDNRDTIITQLGDIWHLGDHKLICGDSNSSKVINALMQGRKADLCVTDPPYNVAYTGATEDELTIENDEMGNDDFLSFLRQFFKSMMTAMKDGAAIYVFHADSEGENFRRAFREAGFKLSQCCVWVKNTFVIGRQDYKWQHEPILYGWKPGAGHSWHSDFRQSTVWHFDKPQRNAIHPTMKPIPLMAYAVQNSCAPRSLVIDFFSGSGSTLMACQKIDRICNAIELDPKYVDATVLRYKELFPAETITLERDGNIINYADTGL